MKIGFFTNTYLPVPYGMEVSIESFRKNLEKLGHEVFVFAPYYKGYEDKNPRIFRFRAVKIFRKKEVYLPFPFLPKNRKLKDVLKIKFDIVHAHSPFSMGLFAKYISSKQRVPFVYTHHIQYAEYAKLYFKKRLTPPSLVKLWNRWFSNLADLVIVPSSKIKHNLEEYGIRKKIAVLATGINTKIFKTSKSAKKLLKKKIKIPSKNKILLFVGRIEIEKNPDFLIEVLCRVLQFRKDIVLLMIGEGSHVKNLKKKAKKLKVDKSVIFLGKIPHSKIAFYYQGADIFVFSSLTETQGIIMLEAAACGLPIVALYDKVFTNVVQNKKNGFLIRKENSDIFAKQILYILNNHVIYNRFSSSSRKIARHFSELKQTKKLLKIYQTLLK